MFLDKGTIQSIIHKCQSDESVTNRGIGWYWALSQWIVEHPIIGSGINELGVALSRLNSNRRHVQVWTVWVALFRHNQIKLDPEVV